MLSYAIVAKGFKREKWCFATKWHWETAYFAQFWYTSATLNSFQIMKIIKRHLAKLHPIIRVYIIKIEGSPLISNCGLGVAHRVHHWKVWSSNLTQVHSFCNFSLNIFYFSWNFESQNLRFFLRFSHLNYWERRKGCKRLSSTEIQIYSTFPVSQDSVCCLGHKARLSDQLLI